MNSSGRFSSSTETRSGRWRRARRVVIGLGVFATVVIAFYTLENWRGKRAWENCRRELEAQGANYDWSSRIPPAVPDEQNIFKAPKMTEWFAGRGSNDLSQRLTDPRTASVGSATNAIHSEANARDYLAWSDQFAPDFELIRTALKRPYARIDCDYREPMTVLAPNFITARNVAQTLAQRTHCFLLLKQPDKALEELTLLHDLCRILEGAPTGKPMTLVAAMINVAISGLYAETVAEGFRLQAWREPQLDALGRQLDAIRLAPFLAETFQNEPVSYLRSWETLSRAELVKGWEGSTSRSLLLRCAPEGWLYQNMVVHARLVNDFSKGVDPTSQTVDPLKIDDAGRTMSSLLAHVSPYNSLASWTPNYVLAIKRLARNQTMVNEANVACALERYRLAHAEYPETLGVLKPEFAAELPHDFIGGQSLIYRRTEPGKFVLYSVGWNGKDDGGNAGKTREEGDWVWLSRPDL